MIQFNQAETIGSLTANGRKHGYGKNHTQKEEIFVVEDPMLISALQLYKENDEDMGIGTVISMTLPYSISFLGGLVLLLPGTPMWL